MIHEVTRSVAQGTMYKFMDSRMSLLLKEMVIAQKNNYLNYLGIVFIERGKKGYSFRAKFLKRL